MKRSHLLLLGVLVALGVTAIVISNLGTALSPAATVAPRQNSAPAQHVAITADNSAVHPASKPVSSISGASAASVGAPLAQPIPPDATTACVMVDGQPQTLVQDDIGNYPIVTIKAKASIPVTLSYPKGRPGDGVLVRVEDGGNLNAHDAAKLLELNAKKNINFDFASNLDSGIYRIVATKGSETSVLQFWVGPEMPHAHRTLDAQTASAN